MKSTCTVALSLWFLAQWSHAQDAGPPLKLVSAVKHATVFIQVRGNDWQGSGSGFVISVKKDIVLIATNYHVIAGPGFERNPKPTPGELARTVKSAEATVVFDSGTRTEQSLRAEAIAGDPEKDLAILCVAGVKAPPAPIDYANPPELVETMGVYSFGFPFGKALATGSRSPAVTVGKASISSIRLDEDGELSVVQIDGALNPGNSGGPIVSLNGKLVGVAVATIRNSTGIGLAVPARELGRMMLGRLGDVHANVMKSEGGKMTLKAEVSVIDPAGAVGSVTLYYLPLRSVRSKPIGKEPLEKLTGARKAVLKVAGGMAAGEITLDSAVQELLVQATLDKSGEPHQRTAIRQISLEKDEEKADIKTALKSTAIQGGGRDPEFEDPAHAGLLVGFEVGLGKWFRSDVVHAIRPIFRSEGKETLGKQWGKDTGRTVEVVAKPGYAIGGITVKTALLIDGFSVTFMKVVDGKLDPKVSYESAWIGGMGGGPKVKIGGGGTPIVGIAGKTNREGHVSGIGLLEKGGVP